MTWQQFPFVRLLLPFLLGIVMYAWLGALFTWTIHLVFFVAMGIVLFGLSRKPIPSIRDTNLWGICLMLLMVHLGYLLSYKQDSRNAATHFAHELHPEGNSYWVSVASEPKLSAKTVGVNLETLQGKDAQGKIEKKTGSFRAYFQLDSVSSRLKYGDQLYLKANLQALEAPLNPKAFDSRNFYYPKNIFHQAYIPSGQWKRYEANQGSSLQHFIFACRNRLLKILKEQVNSPNEYAVAAALILGAKDNLSSELRNAYADTGAMHVLAVSGLHVGILAAILNVLLGLIKWKNKHWERLRVLLLLVVLWSFALLTGASASVLRACTMFSFVIGGQLLSRKINVYNSLAGSAFFLLCLNPFMLFDIGFQLSYIALFGIVYLHPKIYKRWYIESKLGDWIWNGVALSVAAQLATLPISLYYFHQFPLFFWLSGVVVTAIAGFILGLGMALFFVNGIPCIGMLVAYLLYASIWLMNSIIFMIQQLPGAVWEGFWLESWEMWLWYLVIISSILLLLKQQLKWAYIPLSFSLILFSHRAYEHYMQVHQQQLCIYHSRKNTIIGYTDGKSNTTLTNSSVIGHPQLLYAQQNHLWSLGINEQNVHSLEDSIRTKVITYSNKKGQFREKRLLLYSQAEVEQESHTLLDVDYVLVHGNPKLKSVQAIEDLCVYKTLIFDASNSAWKIKKWKEECISLGIDFVDITSDGAWIEEL